MTFKAPAFWYRPAHKVSRALAPLGFFYAGAVALRRVLARPYHAKVPVLCVGNVVVGGAGKTPTVLSLAQKLLARGEKPVFVTRGYGGRERGPVRVDVARHTAADVGDEPLLLARVAPVWIARDRAAAVREAEKEATHILLDDGLQNPSVHYDASLLVMDGGVGVGNGAVLPVGPLREPLARVLKRVDAVVVIGPPLAMTCAQPLFSARLQACLPSDFPRAARFFAFAGIGHPEKFYATCRAEGLNLIGTADFGDHHAYTDADISRLEAAATGAILLTTEKDWVRLPEATQKKVLTVPIALVWAKPEAFGLKGFV